MLNFFNQFILLFKNTEEAVIAIDNTDQMNYNHIFIGCFLSIILSSFSSIFPLQGNPLMVFVTVLTLSVGLVVSLFIGSFWIFFLIKLLKGNTSYYKITNLYPFLLLAGSTVTFLGLIPLIGPLLSLIAALYACFIQYKALALLGSVSPIKLFLASFLGGVLLLCIFSFIISISLGTLIPGFLF